MIARLFAYRKIADDSIREYRLKYVHWDFKLSDLPRKLPYVSIGIMFKIFLFELYRITYELEMLFRNFIQCFQT